jgi:hypothetical protein
MCIARELAGRLYCYKAQGIMQQNAPKTKRPMEQKSFQNKTSYGTKSSQNKTSHGTKSPKNKSPMHVAKAPKTNRPMGQKSSLNKTSHATKKAIKIAIGKCISRFIFDVEGGFKENHAHGIFVEFGFRPPPVGNIPMP